MQLAENTVVAGRFRLKRLIGKGGMGSVWEADHLRLDIPCAVKFMDLTTFKEAHARFEREAKAAAQLRSPNVVQILDHGVCDDGTPYIAMELLDGEDLGKRLARLGRLLPPDLVNVVGQVCRALTRAHTLGIVHRDLKPDNIFIVRDDDREIAKVLDFGIAKNLVGNELTGSSTKTGAMLGTPFYMSPEQAQGTKQVDARSDLWAMAIICFEALTGRRPFVSDALGDLLIQIIVAPLPMPSQFAQVPVGFDAWWTRAASRDPSMRFQTAREFGDSLALVCGISQISGVTDLPRRASQTNPPPPYTPNPGDRPNTPPVSATTQAVPGTPSPVARSSPSIATPSRGSKVGLVFGAIGGSIVLVAGLVGVVMALRSRPAGDSRATADTTVAATAAMPPPPVDTVAKPPPSASETMLVPGAVTLTPPEPSSSSAETAASASVAKPPPLVPWVAPHPTGGVPPAGTGTKPKKYNSGI
jgi:serine/threonine-protein kinase